MPERSMNSRTRAGISLRTEKYTSFKTKVV
jgi:hypothetical protein